MKITRVSAHDERRELHPPLQPIRPAAAVPTLAPAPAPGSAASYARPFANERQNSRLATPLPSGNWQQFWQSEVRSDFKPSFVVQDGDRIVVQAGIWQLFSEAGKPLKAARSGPAPIILDRPNGLFYGLNRESEVAAYQLDDGQPRFMFPASMGEEGAYSCLTRRGRQFLMVAKERQLDPHGHHKANLSEVHVVDLGEPPEISETGLLLSINTVGTLQLATNLLLAALNNDRVVVAAPGVVLVTDWAFDSVSGYTDDFTPRTLSVDETGGVYMTVATRGVEQFWRLTDKGERLFSAPLPTEFEAAVIPPLIRHDHISCLIVGRRLMAFSPQGTVLWEKTTVSSIGGAVVTGNDHLLVSTGSELLDYDADGRSRILANFPGETLCTPPILSNRGEILLASETALHCLRPQP